MVYAFKIFQKRSFLLSILFLIPSCIQASEMPEPQYDYIKDHVKEDSFVHMLNGSFNNALQIIQITQQLSLLVHNNQIHVPTQKQKLLEILRTIQSLLGAILNDQVIISHLDDPEMQLICSTNIMILTDEVSKTLEFVLDHNFKKIPNFDLKSLFQRSSSLNLSFEKCQKKFKVLSKRIERLQVKSQYAGLTWYNITTRDFEKYILDPALKWHLHKALKYGSIGTAFVAIMLWTQSYDYMAAKMREEAIKIENFDANNPHAYYALFNTLKQKDFIFKIMSNLQKHLGVIKPKAAGGSTDAVEACSLIYNIIKSQADSKVQIIPMRDICVLLEGCISDLGLARLPVAMLVGSLLVKEYKQLWVQELNLWLTKKRELLWNFLRGGAYAQNSVSGVWDMQPSIRFKDVVGMDEIKEQLTFVIKFIENPEQYIRVNAAPPRGYLLTGPTRTGKTYIVDAFCGEIQHMLEKNGRKDEMKFWRINSQVIGEFGLQQVLNFAKENAPIVLFIDEIDLQGLQRVTNNQRLEQFLTVLGSTLDSDPKRQVILITATNKPETLDKALRQPDRLGKEIRFEYPSLEYRERFLLTQLEKMGVDTTLFDLHILSQKTAGKSFADLNSMLNNAIMKSWVQGKQLSQSLLDESIDSEIRHIIFEDRKQLTDHENRIIATHLAGKTLVSLLLDTRLIFDKVTIKAVMPDLKEELPFEEIIKKDEKEIQQKIKHGDIFRYVMSDTINIGSFEQKLNEIKFLIAGSIAEEIILGGTSYEYRHEDLTKAYAYAQDLAFEGLDPKAIGENEFNILSQKAYILLTECKKWVREFMTEHKEDVEQIAQLILDQKTVKASDIHALLKRQKKSDRHDTFPLTFSNQESKEQTVY